MFCPNCGAESTAGLNFCKHCGGSLSDASAAAPALAPARNILAALILALATAGIVLGGIAIVFNFVLAMVGPQPPGLAANHDAVAIAVMMVLFGSGAIIIATLMLIKLFARVMGFGSNNEGPRRAKKAFAANRVAQISGPPLSMESVTEHTTRNFEPRIYRRDTSE